uniref:Uncharacterized protein n=1 Tax=Ammonifex degensii TaxID=42838 RepID=A0A7C1F7R4_9THEO
MVAVSRERLPYWVRRRLGTPQVLCWKCSRATAVCCPWIGMAVRFRGLSFTASYSCRQRRFASGVTGYILVMRTEGVTGCRYYRPGRLPAPGATRVYARKE